jgi:hypothetical protein
MTAIPAIWHRPSPQGEERYAVVIVNTVAGTSSFTAPAVGRAHCVDTTGRFQDVSLSELQVVGADWQKAIAEATAGIQG